MGFAAILSFCEIIVIKCDIFKMMKSDIHGVPSCFDLGTVCTKENKKIGTIVVETDLRTTYCQEFSRFLCSF